MALVPQCLSAKEEAQIHQQFHGGKWQRNNQVLWSGIDRNEAQRWADDNGMQTLTTAMGPLMNPAHSSCLRTQKSSDAWSKYVKGASALFAWYIAKGEYVTVLSPPPPERFNPCGKTSYQLIEEPIVKGMLGTDAVGCIKIVHPTVKGAENIAYQIWPVDETDTWTKEFGDSHARKRAWRMIKSPKVPSFIVRGMGNNDENEMRYLEAKIPEEEAKQETRDEKIAVGAGKAESKQREKANMEEKKRKKKKGDAKAVRVTITEVKVKVEMKTEESENRKKKDKSTQNEEALKIKAEKNKLRKAKEKKEKQARKLQKKEAKKLKKAKKLARVKGGSLSPEASNGVMGMNAVRGDLLIGLMLAMVIFPWGKRTLLH